MIKGKNNKKKKKKKRRRHWEQHHNIFLFKIRIEETSKNLFLINTTQGASSQKGYGESASLSK